MLKMADSGDREENTSRGNDWEVVSLTASTYAASPGPKPVELKDDKKGDSHNEAETSHALLMSRHFSLAPNELENLPLKPVNPEIHGEKVNNDVQSNYGRDQEGISHRKVEEDLRLPEDFTGFQCFDEKAKQEESIYNAAALASLHDESSMLLGSAFEEKDSERNHPGSNLSFNVSPVVNHEEGDKHAGSKMPCKAWWRRSATSLYAQAKEANAFWSVFVAAAVMGLVIVGQRWQKERGGRICN